MYSENKNTARMNGRNFQETFMPANSVMPNRSSHRRNLFATLVTSTLLLVTGFSQAKEIVLYNQPNNVAAPESILVADSNGVLYGVASAEKTGAGCGAVFALTPPAKGQTNWTETILYEFQCSPDGQFPIEGLVPNGQGGFFGTTYGGGVGYNGTVYELAPPGQGQTSWTETILYLFQGGSDGSGPGGKLLRDGTTGVLYGMTFEGGQSSAGTVYALTPPAQGQTNWTETVLYTFTGDLDGGFPYAPLTADTKGALYGATTAGGANGQGTVFKLTAPAQGQTNWAETVLFSFDGWGGADGGNPDAGLVFDPSGNLYSTTVAGGLYDAGTVFELSPPSAGQTAWTETILHSFTGAKDGAAASSDIIMDRNGAIYSTTGVGGASNNGTVFKLSPPGEGQTAWTERVLYSFKKSPDGNFPLAGVTAVKVGAKYVLFGTTFAGGNDNDNGTVYEITNSGFVP